MPTITLPKILANFETSLASKMSDSANTLTLNTSVDDDGNTLSGLYELTIDEGTNSEEHMLVTMTGASGAVSRRGLSRVDFWTEKSANKYEHTRGASVKITNFSLGMITRLLNGDDTFNAVDWTGVNSITGLAAPVNGSDVVNKDYADSAATGTAYVNRIIVAGNGGEAITDGDLLYLKAADNEWYKTDADTAATVNGVILGIAQGAGSDGASITGGILLFGLDDAQAGLTAGTTYYASNTAGDIANAAGTNKKAIGIAQSATTIFFNPFFAELPTGSQKDALAGTSGSPSSTNKYVTNDDTSATSAANKVIRANASGDLPDEFLNLTTAGDTVYSDGTDLTRLPIGSAGQVLRVNSGATAPEWSTLDGIGETGSSFAYQLSMDASIWGTTDATFTTKPGYGTIESSAVTWQAFADLPGVGSDTLAGFNDGKDFSASFRARATNGTTGDRRIGLSNGFTQAYDSNAADFAGFGLNGATLYAVSADSGVGVTTDDISAGITVTNWNVYRVEFEAGTEVRFYVNGTLLSTINTNLPDSAQIRFGAGGTTDTEDWEISNVIIKQEF